MPPQGLDHKLYADKYFLRSKEILQKHNLNPKVKLQVFIRKGDCKVYGISEAVDLINTYAPSAKIWALSDGDQIDPCETVMVIEAPVQDIIDLETMYLGVISSATTIMNDKRDIDLGEIKLNMEAVTKLANPRPVMYMGARHWHYLRDAEISKACFDGGASACSTDIGAGTVGKFGAGTIPHALEAIFHWRSIDIGNKYNLKDNAISDAVFNATAAFDKYIDPSVPRIALIDYSNREILDSLKCAIGLESLWGVRVDTCGENFMQGVMPTTSNSKGVSIKGVYLLRKILNDAGFEHIKIVLSSGFANPDKVRNFIEAEKECGLQLFDMLGVGQVFYSRVSTGDIIEVEGIPIHKVGRPFKNNSKLREVK